ncbi:hypothetical protein EBR77_02295 [bacterium]|nr:hypothetical protein [bacterium]
MKLHTNVFFFATLMVASFVARAEGEVVAAVAETVQVVAEAAQAVAPNVENIAQKGAQAGLLDQAKAAAVAAWNHVYKTGEYGVNVAVNAGDAVVVYAKNGVVTAGKGVTTLGKTIQKNPGYTAAVIAGTIATVAVGYVVYKNYFADSSDCKESKKAKTPKSNN